uniref:Uncharacterized protein n=1 Tax=Gasterosteus aculeatus TaxID=69293 RepID=G3N767_GASAC
NAPFRVLSRKQFEERWCFYLDESSEEDGTPETHQRAQGRDRPAPPAKPLPPDPALNPPPQVAVPLKPVVPVKPRLLPPASSTHISPHPNCAAAAKPPHHRAVALATARNRYAPPPPPLHPHQPSNPHRVETSPL